MRAKIPVYVKPKRSAPSVPSSDYMLHDKTAVFDQEMIWTGSVNWSSKGMQSGGTVFVFRDPDTNIIKTTMDENATKFILMSLKHFKDPSHVACDSCVEHLREYNNKQAVLALENQKRELAKRGEQHY